MYFLNPKRIPHYEFLLLFKERYHSHPYICDCVKNKKLTVCHLLTLVLFLLVNFRILIFMDHRWPISHD